MRQFLLIIISLCFLSNSSLAHDVNTSIVERDLMKLMSLEVENTTAMKRSQSVDKTPASIFVLEQRDIELSGYTRLPQLLKLLLGVDARRIDNNQWAISVRSAASRFNSNLLVMIDGQQVSASIINSISWEVINYPIEDIERIELVRGLNGSLWGNSSSHGLLNIISKHSADTQGSQVKLSIGSEVKQAINLRYGDVINDISSYRLYAGAINGGVSQAKTLDGIYIQPNDDTQVYYFGGQYDLQYAENSAFKAQVSYRENTDGLVERLVDPEMNTLIYNNMNAYSENFLYNLRIDHRFDNGLTWYSQLSGRFSDWGVDKDSNHEKSVVFNTAVNYRLGEHLLSFGGELVNNESTFVGESFKAKLSSLNKGVFIQDQISLFDDALTLTVGTRVDYLKVFERWKSSPSARFNYQFDNNHSLWGAYSKGYRLMINAEEKEELTVFFPNITDSTAVIVRTDAQNSIDYSTGYEIGYRYNHDNFYINTSVFKTQLDSIYISEVSGELINGVATIVNNFVNDGHAKNYGMDFSVGWQVTNNLNMLLGYSYIDYDLAELEPNQIAVTADDYDNQQMYFRSQWSPVDNLSIQMLAKHIGKHQEFGTSAYEIVDISFNWQITQKFKLTFVGQNLANSALVEFPNDEEIFSASSSIGRSANINIIYDF